MTQDRITTAYFPPFRRVQTHAGSSTSPDKLEPDYAGLARRKAQGAADEEVLPRRIEEEAHDLVFGDRQAAYGHPSSDFEAMGRISGAIIQRWLDSEGLVTGVRISGPEGNGESSVKVISFPDIPPRIVALIMTAVKLSREAAVPKRDNRVDLIGYVLCADRVVDGEPDGN